MKQLYYLVIVFFIMTFTTFGQVGINNDGSQPDPSSMLDVKSTTKGFLPPRMTNTQMHSIVSPPEGLIVYNMTVNSLYWYTGANWKKFNEIVYTETDPIFSVHPSSGITAGNISNWNTAYGWGNHTGLYEPLITKSTGYAKWTGTSWAFMDEAYSLSSHNHNGVYDPAGSAFGLMNFHRWEYNHENIAFGVIAYSWGNHASAGYLSTFTETDPIFVAHPSAGITSANISNWNDAYSWGNHTLAGYLTFESDPIFIVHPAASITSLNISDWNTAFSWGNHASAGYLTGFTESDPIFTIHPSSSITTDNIATWHAAYFYGVTSYGWGNHASAGYLTSYTETDPIFVAHPSAGITATHISNWNAAYAWGNHALAGYLTSYTESDPVVKSLNGMVKSNGTNISVATPGTDYLTPTGSAALLTDFPILNQNTTGTASNVIGIVSVSHGGTGNSSFTGYVKGNGSEVMTASSSIPHTDISGLGSMSTQGSGTVSISGGNINGTAIGSTVQASGSFTSLSATGDLTGSPNGTSTISNFSAAIVTKSSVYTLVATDNGKILLFDNSSDVNLTIPTLPTGFNCMVIQNGDGKVTFTSDSGITLNNRSGFTKTAGKYAIATIVAINTTAFIISGDMQ